MAKTFFFFVLSTYVHMIDSCTHTLTHTHTHAHTHTHTHIQCTLTHAHTHTHTHTYTHTHALTSTHTHTRTHTHTHPHTYTHAQSTPATNPISISNAHLNLRVGQPITFDVNITALRNLPLDLYILMDLSSSMGGVLVALREVSGQICKLPYLH